jgi:MoaA/NifB/PqqE/SkfB family radical SAM enzyme
MRAQWPGSSLAAGLGLAGTVAASNLRPPALPYKITLAATYRCNFRCQMCHIWEKRSSDEMTPDEVGAFFARWSQFRWVHLTGGELFVRRDLDDLVEAIQGHCRSLFLLNFPTTGWFGDRTVALVERALAREPGRLMVTISVDGPRPLHEQLRGLPGSWDRALETYRRLRGIRRGNFQVVIGMTVMPANAHAIDDTIAAIRAVVPEFTRGDLHLNVIHESPHYFANVGAADIGDHAALAAAVEAHRRAIPKRLHPVAILEDRYQSLVGAYLDTGRSPLPCASLSSSCFVDPHWNLFACTIWGEPVGNLRAQAFDLEELWESERRRALRSDVQAGRCPHCWTPCEAYPTILEHLGSALLARSTRLDAPGTR